MAIPLKNCDQCSHYRGGYCYGFGTARKVISKSEAILCGTYTPLGQVQIGPIDSLGGQLKAYQLPSGIISTVKLADAAVTLAKLSASSVNDSKVAAGAGIVESKLSLTYGTQALHDDTQTREESSNKGAISGYCGLDVSQLVPLANLSNLTNTQLAVAAGIVESKLSLTHGTQALHDDTQTREESSNKGAISGYCGLDASQLVPLANLSNLTNTQLAVAAGIVESKLSLTHGTQALHDDIQTRALLATYLAHDHSLADPTQVDFNNLLNINPVTLSNIINSGAINIKPSGDLDDYLEISTDGTHPKIKAIGGGNFIHDTDGGVHWFRVGGSNKLQISATQVALSSNVRLVLLNDIELAATRTVDGIDVSEEPARISTEIDTDISTHAGLATAHQDAPALIATHAGIATAHQDAPALITTHAGIATAHHTRYSDAEALAAVDEHLVIGSANAQWINCPYEGAEFVDGDKMRYDGSMEAYYVGGTSRYVYSVPLPTTRGGKSLFINGTRVSLSAADGSNRVYETNLYGMGDTTATELDSDETNKNSVNLWEDVSMGNTNLGGYDVAKVILKTAVLTAGNLKVQFVTVRYYYA